MNGTYEFEEMNGRSSSPTREGPFPTYYRRQGQPMSPDAASQRDSTTKVLPPVRIGVINDDDRVEYPPIPEDEKLGYYSTMALIVSKVIGTGIFVKPSSVLENSGSKGVALLLWAAGGFMSVCGIVIYVELGMAFPFNGGEIVYVEEAFPRPRYLAVTVVSLLFVLVTNYAGNCIMFSKLILQAFEPHKLNPDPRLIKFVAFTTLTAVCLLHIFSRRLGLLANNLLAIYKVAMIIVVIIAGFVAMGLGKGKQPAVEGVKYVPPGGNLLNDSFKKPDQVVTMAMYSNAILGVLWGYTGWENANYVLGEIKRPPTKEAKIFKVSSFGSIALLTSLYLLANISYFGVLTTEELEKDNGQSVVAKLFIKIFGASAFVDKGIKVLVALSVLGNFISIVFAVSRVKQEIAKLRILPFSKFWAKQSHYDTPVGALILHWLFTALLILVLPNSDGDAAYNLATNLFIYAQNWVFILSSFALIAIRYSSRFPNWEPKLLPWKALLCIISVYIPLNIGVIVLTWWPSHKEQAIPQYITPVVSTSIIAFGVVYWFGFAKIMPLLGYHIDSEPDQMIDGSRIITYTRYKTGFAKKTSDWYNNNVRRRYNKVW